MIGLDKVALRRGDFALEVALEVARGARIAVIGASGTGKSTLLDVIAGFAVPEAGRVLIAGVDVTAQPVAKRPVSILFQDGNLFPHLSVFDNVAIGIDPGLRLGAAERDAVDRALADVGLAGFAARKPSELSGGQQARVALARMLLRDQPVALLDEPFAALNPGLRAEMAALVGEICNAKGITLVVVAHELRGLEDLVDEVCLMEAGRILLRGPLRALRDDPPEALLPWL